MAKTEPIKERRNIEKMKKYFIENGQIRNYLLFEMGLYSALRISDIIKLRWKDVYDFDKKKLKSHIYLTEQKTQKKAVVALNDELKKSLAMYMEEIEKLCPEMYIFKSRKGENQPIGRVQAFRILKKAAEELSISGNISCHSLRKTFGYHAYKQGMPVPAIMQIYNHSSYDITRRYLSIDQDEKDFVYLNLKL